MQKVAIFDIDGTIFRSSLLIELTDALVQEGVFPSKVRKIYSRACKDWLDKKGPYEDYIWAVIKAFDSNIKGVRYAEFSRVARKVVAFHKNRNYRYSCKLLKNLKKKNYYLLAISHSPQKVVKEFGRKLGFDKVYGRIFELDKKRRFTGKMLYPELIFDKAKILKRAIEKEKLILRDSVGVGDTESDIPFLKMVERPICFNPNIRLYQYAKKAGWEIVIERKDVIYCL
jgi:HAD superfamily phosphoserine phosphatase-like hydrolase